MVQIFQGDVNLFNVVSNMPANGKANIQTDAEIGIEFWNPAKNGYGLMETLEVPGGTVRCPNNRMRITTASQAFVTITPANS